jgi:ferredoxin-NADP reductase
MTAMTETLLREGLESGYMRPMHFIHGTKNGETHAFADVLHRAAAAYPQLRLHFRYSNPSAGDRLGVTHDSVGYVDGELIRTLVDPQQCDFYLCSPGAFMQSNFDALTRMGVGEDRIHFESFGQSTVRRASSRNVGTTASEDGIPVRFSASGIDAAWTPGVTLLELAEASGVRCRSGSCGTCATRLESGAVEYFEEPFAEPAEGEVLICCAVPRSDRNSDGVKTGITLAL